MAATIRAMEHWDIIVIGGGASGLVAAGAAARKGAKVLVCEKKNRVGLKVGISGKGRGNVTNTKPIDEFVLGFRNGGEWLRPAFARFFSADTIELLARRDVECITERGGRVFPKSGKATDVVNALYRYARGHGGAVRTDTPIDEVLREGDRFLLRFGEEWLEADRVILATGGQSYQATGSTGDGFRLAKALGHSIVAPRPALAPLLIDGLPPDLTLHLKNATVSLFDGDKKIAGDFGEALLEKGMLAGPVGIALARDVLECRKPRAVIDLKPALDEAKLDARLRRDLEADGKKQLLPVLKELLPQALIPLFMQRLQLDPQKRCAEVSKKTRQALGRLCKNLAFPVTGIGDWATALVTVGGVKLNEVNPNTMESKRMPGLFLCGEVLDVDAISGGYNLQAAFSTGFVAGESAAEKRA